MRIDESRLRIFPPPIAAGGTAEILPCELDGRAMLYKRYRTQYLASLNTAALDRLVEWRSMLTDDDRRQLDEWCAWPIAVVYRSSAASGLLMPRTPPGLTTGGQPARTLSDLRRLDPDLPHSELQAATVEALTAFGHIAKVMLWLHRYDVVVNDVQPLNVLVSPDHHRIYLVDCDAMIGMWGRVGPPAAPVYFNELISDPPGPASDLAKLAWCIFFVLLDDFALRGLGPDVQRNATQYLQKSTVELLVRSATRRDDVARLQPLWQERASAWITAGESGMLILDTGWFHVTAEQPALRVPRQAADRVMAPTVPLGRQSPSPVTATVPAPELVWSDPAESPAGGPRRRRRMLVPVLVAVGVVAVLAAVYLDHLFN
ncbi:hypothetical protein [Verrucosispora sp. WMMC514]|uniref:hypothetical protein n=1 Tax=Verrucosispora sp. WMMC514 TaxID=3015156 RepID=UPI00248C9744|nr:hypothetical protein [Verrucosispora sp. WMMC514]WBB93381.1 hypothetical protein O7597_10585 [Verrucosispora sp. WMMC514]